MPDGFPLMMKHHDMYGAGGHDYAPMFLMYVPSSVLKTLIPELTRFPNKRVATGRVLELTRRDIFANHGAPDAPYKATRGQAPGCGINSLAPKGQVLNR